ncbi:MAG: insulinase family protein [Planctomycetes bacterium]|nr:insulinase family protein [Planctomycetota bacterium]
MTRWGPRPGACRAAAAAALVCALAAAALAPTATTRFAAACDDCAEETQVVLPNGLRVLRRGNHREAVVLVLIAYHAGVRHEAVRAAGTAHVLERLLRGGPAGEGGALQPLANVSEPVGSDVRHDVTCFWEAVAPANLGPALAYEARRMRGAALEEGRFREVLTSCVAEARAAEENPVRRLWGAFFRAAFPVHPYGRPRRGVPEETANLAPARVREFYDTFYRPDNATLVLLGDIPEDRIGRMVAESLGTLPRSSGIPVPIALEPPQTAPRRVELRAPTPWGRVLLGFRLPAVEHADHPALAIARALLAARLRAAGDADGLARELAVWGESAVDYRDPHLLVLAAEAAAPAALPELEERLRGLVTALGATAAGAEELEAARRAAAAEIGGAPALDPPPAGQGDALLRYYLEVAQGLARRAPRAEFLAGAYGARLRAVDGDAVRAAAARYLTPQASTVAVLTPGER